jgi:hypothetical protein
MADAVDTLLWSLEGDDIPCPELVVVEQPQLWSRSARSYSAAVRGDTFKLANLAGALWQAFREKAHVVLVHPEEWKGQLSKKVTLGRLRRVFEDETLKYGVHAMDAVGMGVAIQGRL